MRSHFKALLNRDFWRLQLLVIEESERGNVARVPKDIEWRTLEPNEQPPRDSIIDLPSECGQQLIDQLWQMGYRPNVGVSSTGQDEAQKDHINDFRMILFSLLAVERKEVR